MEQTNDNGGLRHKLPWFRNMSPSRWVAMLCFPVAVALCGYLFIDADMPSAGSPITTTAGTSSATVRLPDGTGVALQPLASLSYESDFGAGCRRVDLKGSANFTVAKKSNMAFVVTMGPLEVKTDGGIVNVTARDGGRIDVCVVTGRATVSTPQGALPVGSGTAVSYEPGGSGLTAY